MGLNALYTSHPLYVVHWISSSIVGTNSWSLDLLRAILRFLYLPTFDALWGMVTVLLGMIIFLDWNDYIFVRLHYESLSAQWGSSTVTFVYWRFFSLKLFQSSPDP